MNKLLYKRSVEELGGNFLESAPSWIEPLLRSQKEFVDRSVGPKVMNFFRPEIEFHSFVVGPKALNAYAIPIEDNKYLIALDAFLIMQLYSLFTGIVELPAFMPRLTSPWRRNLDADQRGALERLQSKSLRIISPVFREFGRAVPAPERAQLAMTLSYFALEFCFMHELGHIVKGHLNARNAGAVFFSEVERHGVSIAPQTVTTQHFELQADEYVIEALGPALSHYAQSDFSKQFQLFGPLGFPFSNGADIYTAWLCAVAGTFLILSRAARINGQDFETSSHPFTPFRFTRLIERARLHFPSLVDHIQSGGELSKSLEFMIDIIEGAGKSHSLKSQIEQFEATGARQRVERSVTDALRKHEPILADFRMKMANQKNFGAAMLDDMELSRNLVSWAQRLPQHEPAKSEVFRQFKSSSDLERMAKSVSFRSIIPGFRDGDVAPSSATVISGEQ